MKIGNITFKLGAFSGIFVVLGVIALFTAPLSGLALITAGVLMSSDWRHRGIAQAAVWITYIVLLQAWLFLLAGGIGGLLVYRKIPHAFSYACWLVAAAALFSGSWLAAVFVAVLGVVLWKVSVK